MRTIAENLQVPIQLAKAVVGSMIESGELETRGQTRGTRYYRKVRLSGVNAGRVDMARALIASIIAPHKKRM